VLFAYFGPLMAVFLVAMAYAVLNLVAPMPDPSVLLAFLPSGWVEIALKSYPCCLTAGYAVAVARLLRRPRDADRPASYVFVMGYPLLLLGFGPILDATDQALLGIRGTEFRVATFLVWVVYAVGFGYLRREGECMRALPKENGPMPTDLAARSVT
jgi:hypothetical protein